MKVLHVITSLVTAGAEHLLVDLLPLLRDKGVNVEICVFNGTRFPFYEQLEQTGIKIHKFGVKDDYYNPLHIYRLGQLMKGFDIVHTHNTSPQLFAALASRLVKTKLITTEHNTSNRRRNKSWLRPIDKWMYKQYDTIICISDQAKTNLTTYLPELADKICTIYNGIAIHDYRAQCDSGTKSQNDEILITMVAAFREQKDQKTLIRAIAILPSNYKLRLVGTGDLDLITQCKELANSLNLANRIDFMGMRSDVPALLASSDIIVLSSHYEGLSLSSLEGMASGRPFIASDVDGLHEIVDGYGVLVPHGDPQAMADAIKKLATDTKYAQEVAQRCVERARMFDIETMAEKYNALYQ